MSKQIKIIFAELRKDPENYQLVVNAARKNNSLNCVRGILKEFRPNLSASQILSIENYIISLTKEKPEKGKANKPIGKKRRMKF